MIILKQAIRSFLICILLSSCGIFGMHVNVHNPKNAKKYPEFSKAVTLIGELTPIRKNFDVVFYNLDIAINPTERSLGGWVEIKSLALSDIDSIQLDLDKRFTIEELRAEAQTGAVLTYQRQFKAVYVKLHKEIKRGELFSVHVKYSGKPLVAKKPPWSGGVVWKKDKQKNSWIGVACEAEGASIWFPCKDHTSDEPDSVHLRFTIPDKGLSVVSNGIFMGSEKKSNVESFRWKIGYPINAYDITFYVGNFEKIEDTYTGITSKTLKLTHYALKPNVERATKHFKQVKDYIRIYEQLYGEYPWYADGFKLVEAPYAGMEHQTAIAYGNGYKNDLYGKVDYIMLHETGHEWFGNAITAADLADVWLQEGITTYGEVLYLEKKYGSATALKHLLFYRLFIKNKRSVVGPVGKHFFDYRDGDAYTKGAWILHTLRNNVNNDSTFFTILKTFYEEHKLKVTDSKAFIATVNSITNKNYNWFFNQYLYRNEAPFLEYELLSDGSLYYRWTAVAEEFNQLAVSVSITGENTVYELYPGTQVQKLKIPNANPSSLKLTIDNTKALFGIKKNKKLHKIYAFENARR